YLLEELDGTVFETSIHRNWLKPFFLLLDLVSLNIEFLDKLVNESMDLPDRDDEERLDKEILKEDLFDEN
ncbi:hypothetical protein, partial [Streptococcus agalactiae]